MLRFYGVFAQPFFKNGWARFDLGSPLWYILGRFMRNNLIIASVIIILIAVGLVGIYWAWQQQKIRLQAAPSPTPSPLSNFPSTLGESEMTGTSPSVQPQAGTDTASVNLGIEIITPIDNAKVSSPVIIKGMTNIPEESVIVEIKNNQGKVLGLSRGSACFDSQPCVFEASVLFETNNQDFGTIEVRSPQGEYSDSVKVLF